MIKQAYFKGLTKVAGEPAARPWLVRSMLNTGAVAGAKAASPLANAITRALSMADRIVSMRHLQPMPPQPLLSPTAYARTKPDSTPAGAMSQRQRPQWQIPQQQRRQLMRPLPQPIVFGPQVIPTYN